MTEAAERLWQALRVPDEARVDRRVAKSLLVEKAELTAADRCAVETGIERLLWRATLKPGTVGLSAFADATRDYTDVVVMSVTFRADAKAARLVEVIHRAVTAPLLLIVDEAHGASLSVGLKRKHERETSRVVVERIVVSPPVPAKPDDVLADAFLTSLDIALLPARDLWSLSVAIAERVETFTAASATGEWRLPRDDDEAMRRRDALGRLDAQRREVDRLRRAASTEKRLAARIELAGGVTRAEAELYRTLASLA